MKKTVFILSMMMSVLFPLGCGDSDDDTPSDQCSDCETDSGETQEADISGMPIPSASGVAKPAGTPGNLKVLDWAGFKSAVSYTFDDTQPSQIQHYDELQATGVRMTFFANSGNSNIMNFDTAWSQAVTDGHEIGNHTAHHCKAAQLDGCSTSGTPADSAEAEIEECSTYIAEHFGQENTWTMASPFGDYNWNTHAEKYFFLNRSINNGRIAPNAETGPFNLPSVMLSGGETADDINADLDAAHENGEWLIFCFHSILPTSQNWYAGVEIESITGSIDHMKSLEEMWADSMVNVGAYWIGQKLLTQATPETSGDNTTWTWTLPDHFPPGRYVRVTVDGGTLKQGDTTLTWSEHGYYEVALDAGSLTLAP